MCTLFPLNTGSCANAKGGAAYAYATSLDNITAITVTAGVITAVTVTDPLVKLVPNKNQTSKYDEVGARPNEFSNQIIYNCEGFASFSGKSSDTKKVADSFASCCQLVVFWVLNNGNIVVQGLEIDAAAAGGFTGSKEGDCRCTPSHLSDTSANESRLELVFNSKNALTSPFTDLTPAELEAL